MCCYQLTAAQKSLLIENYNPCSRFTRGVLAVKSVRAGLSILGNDSRVRGNDGAVLFANCFNCTCVAIVGFLTCAAAYVKAIPMPSRNRGIFIACFALLFYIFLQIPGSDFRPVHIALMIYGNPFRCA